MILVDTSVWIDHLRTGDEELTALLNNTQVLIHPFVVGELACGNLIDREVVLKLLQALPQVPVASDSEVLFFIEQHRLMGCGIGYIDTHLLASTALAGSTKLWTRDKNLAKVSTKLILAH